MGRHSHGKPGPPVRCSPKIQNCDLIIVRVDPVNRPEAPRTVRDIFNRTVEISHNSTFWLEMGAIAVVLRFVDEGRSPFRRLRFHMKGADFIWDEAKLNRFIANPHEMMPGNSMKLYGDSHRPKIKSK